jgi:hypothetical protein
MVPIYLVTVRASLVVDDGPAFHVLVVVVHVDIPLRISGPRNVLIRVHLAPYIEVFNILLRPNGVLKCVTNAFPLIAAKSLKLRAVNFKIG